MSDDPFIYDVFLSFARQNEALARPLFERLARSGLRVFWSDEAMRKKVGQNWYEVIEASLLSSKHFVLLWSSEAEKSRFVKKEYQTFDSLFFDPPARLLVPVLVPRTETGSLPVFLQTVQSYTLDDEAGLGHLIESVGGRYEPLAEENARLRAQLAEAEERIEALEKAAGDSGDLKKARTRIATLEREQKRQEKQYADLEKKAAGMEEENEKLKAELEAARDRVASLRREAASLKALQAKARVKPGSAAKQATVRGEITDDYGVDYVLIEPGTFRMGSEKGGEEERPVHTVKITRPFYLGKFPVTQGQWEKVMGKNLSSSKKGSNYPVESVSWNDVQQFLQKLKGGTYRLPTEAEWEYACRAGTDTEYFFGEDAGELGRYAWFDGNSGGSTHPVGEKEPNTWGLYDMAGNVWEWVQDWYDENYYKDSPSENPEGPSKGKYRVLRGGSFYYALSNCRCAARLWGDPYDGYGSVGFRLVLLP